MIELAVTENFQNLEAFSRNVQASMGVAVQLAAGTVREIAREEVIILEAYDTYALMESIYVANFRASDYEERCDDASNAALNNPTKWPDIRNTKLYGNPMGLDLGGRDASPGNTMPIIEFDPPVHSDSRFDAWVAVAASHGKYVENGYISWYDNWVPARPFWQATVDRATPIVIQMIRDAINTATLGSTFRGVP